MSSQECPATGTKVCKDCGVSKTLDEFYKKSGEDRYFAVCKPCFGIRSAASYQKRRKANLRRRKQYVKENEDRVKNYLRGWYQKNREKVIVRSKAYQARPDRVAADKSRHEKRYLENREEIRAKQSARNATPEGKRKQREIYQRHYKAKPHYYIAKGAERRARELKATPAWVDLAKIRDCYAEAKRLTLQTGVKHVVDHIVPLKGRNVCGLHVAENLQVIPEKENLRKFNKFG